MTKKIVIAALAFVLSFGSAYAVTITNSLGQVVTTETLSEVADDGTSRTEWSTPAGRPGIVGVAVIDYQYSVNGAIASNRAITLDSDIDIPYGAVFMDGYLRVRTGATAGALLAVSVGGVTNVAASTNFQAAGLYDVDAAAYTVPEKSNFVVTNTGVAVAAGDFSLYLPYMLAP